VPPADWERQHPLTAGLDLSEWRVQRVAPETVPAGDVFLWLLDPVRGRVPLATVVGTGDVASVHFGFALQDSNLPLLPAFPQLLRRAFVRAYGSGAAVQPWTPPPAAGEQDLLRPARAGDRPLPTFGAPARSLAGMCLLAALVAMMVRAFVR
jgi:hypothetical protein